MDAHLRTRALEKRFGATTALRGIDLEVSGGELFGLVGPDGAGKTTLIRLLAGLMAPSSGEVRVLGFDPAERRSPVREVLGLMPQRHSLYGDLSVDENLSFFARLYLLDRETFRERRTRLLDITRLAAFGSRRADALSGGMYKKLALCCALLHRPRVLLLDEPTNGVDPVSRRELWELLGELVRDGMTVFVSTPYMDEAARCSRVGFIHQGRLLALDTPRQLVAGLEHGTYEVRGLPIETLEQWADHEPALLALSPAHDAVRVVAHRARDTVIRDELARRGAVVASVPPGFEDVFLARVAERRSA